jgi:hypothetical protein
MLVNGDKLVVTKDVADFLKEGDIVKVVDTNENGSIAFAFGDGFMHKGLMSASECEEHFKKYEEPKAPTVTQNVVEKIMLDSDIEVMTIFDKCTIVACKLPNGFVIVESSACVSPENYDEEVGVDICLDKIASKIWELEGYKLQDTLYEESDCSCDCDECPSFNECYEEDDDDEFEEDFEEDNELDCDECDEYSCPDNPNYRSH